MTMTWDERTAGESPKTCGMCGVGRMGEKERAVPGTKAKHRIYLCLDCGHEYVDITHHDSKVMARRAKYGLK